MIKKKIERTTNKDPTTTGTLYTIKKKTKTKSEIEQKRKLKESLKKTYSEDLLKIQRILTGINTKSSTNINTKFKDIYSLLCKPALLIQALGNIRPNKGSSTPGINDETLDEMNLNKITNISLQLKTDKFFFFPVKRVNIPKPGKKATRPLGIPTFTDRIVQEGIRIILEAIFEPEFEKQNFKNFGFRPNKSPHDCIVFLKNTGTACNYAIEGDIIGAFNNVDIPILMNILRKKIQDKKFLALIQQGCHSGLLEMGKYKDTLLGVPQGGIASPILFNIYMHEFDLFINNELISIIKKFNEATNRKEGKIGAQKSLPYRNKLYKKISANLDYRRKTILEKKNRQPFKSLPLLTQIFLKKTIKIKKQLELQRIRTESIDRKKRPVRIVYTRYADDFIILTNSTLKFAEHIKDQIKYFLENTLKLQLSEEKTKITNLNNNYARFLGFVLYSYHTQKISRDPIKKTLVRSGGYNIKAGIDMNRVLKRLTERGFCGKTHRPIGKAPFSVLPIKEIIAKFNYIIRGTANYFLPMVDTFRSFTQIYYILSYSCYGTISTKLKSSIYKIFKKFGTPPIFRVNAKIKTTTGFYKQIEEKHRLITYLESKKAALALNEKSPSISSDIFSPMAKINWRTAKNLNAFCVICGTQENVEWHHVHAIRKGKVVGFAQVMKQLNRKQIPLCRQHHLEVENGIYDEIKLSDLVQIEYWLV